MNPESVGNSGFYPGAGSSASAGHSHSVSINIEPDHDGSNVDHDHDNSYIGDDDDNHDNASRSGKLVSRTDLMSDGAADATVSPAAEQGTAGKKRKLVTGSRGVAHLTPEQLAKKRANDREAQRAIRERTKNTIEALQHKIHELSNTDHMLELQKAQQAREFVERENADIKRRLIAIMGMLEPLVHAQLEPQPCIPPTPQAYAPSLVVHSTGALSYNSPSTTQSASPAASLQQHQHYHQQQHQQQQQHSQQHQHHHHQHHQNQHQHQHQQIHQTQLQHWQSSGSSRIATPLSSHIPAHGLATFDDFTRSQLEQQRQALQHGFEMGHERLNLSYVLSHDTHGGSLTGIPKIERGVSGAQDTPSFHHVPMKHDWTQVSQMDGQGGQAPAQGGHDQAMPSRPNNWEVTSSRFDHATMTLSPPQMPSGMAMSPHHGHTLAAIPPGYPRHDAQGPGPGPGPGVNSSYMGMGRGLPPPYAIPVNNCAPTCPLDSLLLDFISERQQRRHEGLDPYKVAGPQYPSVSSLLNPENAKFSHPLSKFFTDILGKFPDISKLPERVAVLYVMFVFMRWQVLLSSDTYNQLPDWIVPSPNQVSKPHPIWIDYLPFPEMRERLVEKYHPVDYAFDNFFVPYTKTLTLSWPYEGTDTLLQDPASDEVMINPVFFRHLRNLDNWKLVGPDFDRAFPALAGSYNRG